MKILIADKFEQRGVDGLAALGAEVVALPTLEGPALTDAIAQHQPEILIVRSTKVPAESIAAGSDLRVIIRAGSGTDNIDLAAATESKIAVCNCPGMNAVAVAELAMGLLLCCDRRLPDQTSDLRAGAWKKKEYGGSRGLKGTRLGVVGVGFIGEALVERAQAFGIQIVAWSRSLTPERAEAMGAEFGGNTRADLLAMLGRCDAVSVHVALNDDTRGMCDSAFFGAMRDGAYFINTARGGVVDSSALAEAVRSKSIRCGLDVYCDQPTPGSERFADPIMELPGVYGTHHCGASTEQAQLAVADEVVRIVRAYKESGRFENRVNGGAIEPVVRPTGTTSERVTS